MDYDDGHSMSSETRAAIEEEVRKLVQGAYGRAKNVLTKHERDLHRLADELLEKETLSGEQIKVMLGIRVMEAAAAAAASAVGKRGGGSTTAAGAA